MLVLALDASGPNCAAAVARLGAGQPALLSRHEERIGRGHAERLPLMVDAALADAGAGYADIQRIAVTVGPGSFTGVRVGVAFARGLALALDISAVGIGTLEALAHPHTRSDEGTLAAVLDARRGEVYALVRDLASGRTLVEPAALPVGDLALRLSRAAPPVTLTGSGAPLLAEALAESEVRIAGAADSPDIADVVALAAEAREGVPPIPLYARAADAKPQMGKGVARS